MMRGIVYRSVPLVILAAKSAWANPAMGPWITTGQQWAGTVTSAYVPLVMSLVTVGIIASALKWGDQDSWIANLLRVGVLTSIGASAVTWVLFWSGGSGVAAATLSDLVQGH